MLYIIIFSDRLNLVISFCSTSFIRLWNSVVAEFYVPNLNNIFQPRRLIVFIIEQNATTVFIYFSFVRTLNHSSTLLSI